MKKYEIIKFKNLEWYYLGEENGIAKLLLKNNLNKEQIKKYYDGDDFMINGADVRHQDNIRPYDWNKSYIKNVILPNFLKDLEIVGDIDLLTKEDVEELPLEIKKSNNWYWTKSLYSSDSSLGVAYVNTSGYVNSDGTRNGFGVRPVLYIDKSMLYENKNNILEKLNEDVFYNKQLHLAKKINEIIDYLDYLKSKGE